jgi:4-hydroxy-2-oxoheptanedioate aldolase
LAGLSRARVSRPDKACAWLLPVTNTPFAERVRGGETVYGGWLGIAGPISAWIVASAGLDYVAIDLQHGEATEHDLPGMTSAIKLAGAAPLARVRHAHPADIGRALDLGCEGVIVPNVESADQARAVVGACRYPPEGYRSAGGALPRPEEPLCVVMVESSHAMTELPATLRLAGLDGIYVGPRDLAYSLSCPLDPHDPVFRSALERIWSTCATVGMPVGVHATDGETARLYKDSGCRLVTAVADTAAVSRGAALALAAVRA